MMIPSSFCSRLPLLAVAICIAVTRVVADGNNPMSAPAAGQVVTVAVLFDTVWIPGTPGPVNITLLTAKLVGAWEEGI
jgi:hypothetical protein